ncbi:MAG: flagellar hook-associated protein FlgK [Desulfobacteraceae bacterium]|jgi:flagellar hook-associated protein 1 FlgK
MTGIGSTLSIAKLALSAQQYGISVTGQNVANVDNENYTRQTLDMTSGTSVKIGSLVLGNGVSVSQIKSVSDAYLESSLMDKKSALACYEEKELYLSSLENIIASNGENGLSALVSEFWNAWSDLSNNPSGDAERMVVYETGEQLAEQFNSLSQSLNDIKGNLDNEMGTSVSQINSITAQIAGLNSDIVSVESGGGTANDLRDQRSALLSELSSMAGITTFEESDGSVSVLTAKSFPLVSGNSSHTLEYSSGQILWNGTDNDVDITDSITKGQLKGWLEIRDETLPELQAELDGLSEALIYQVNLQTSQGVGSDYMSQSMTGSYAVDSSGLFSTLDFADKLDTSAEFVLWIKNSTTTPSTFTDVSVDLSNLNPVSATTFDVNGTANSVNDTYVFKVDPPTATMGGASDVTITWSSGMTEGRFTIEAGNLSTVFEIDGLTLDLSAESGPFNGGTFTVTTDSEGVPSENVSAYTLSDLATDINTAISAAGGGVSASVSNGRLMLSPDSSQYSFAFGNDNGTNSGLAAILGLNTFFTGTDASTMAVDSFISDTSRLQTGQINSATGAITSGDNSNALLTSAIQDTSLISVRWEFNRGSDATSSSIDGTAAELFESLASEIGIQAKISGIQTENYQELVNSLQEQRDSVSAVSLDEEVINLTKYQTAYSAASKLLSIADEMLDTLLSIR